jgi:hypothetical protein
MRANSRTSLERVGIHVSRYGLVVKLLLIGVLKFAAGIQPLVAQPGNVLALLNLQPSGHIEFDWSDRDCCRVANRAAAVFREAHFHRLRWRHH